MIRFQFQTPNLGGPGEWREYEVLMSAGNGSNKTHPRRTEPVHTGDFFDFIPCGSLVHPEDGFSLLPIALSHANYVSFVSGNTETIPEMCFTILDIF